MSNSLCFTPMYALLVMSELSYLLLCSVYVLYMCIVLVSHLYSLYRVSHLYSVLDTHIR